MHPILMPILRWFRSTGLSGRSQFTVHGSQCGHQQGEKVQSSTSAPSPTPEPASNRSMRNQPFKRISKTDVNRDANGYWRHPDFPQFDESEHEEFKTWLATHRLTSRLVQFQEELTAEGHCTADRSKCGRCSSDDSQWEPPMPKGNGWFILGIWGSGVTGSPVCLWARYLEVVELEQQASYMAKADMLSLTFIHVPDPLCDDPEERGEVSFNYGIEDYDALVKDEVGNRTLAFMLRAAILEQGWCLLNGEMVSVVEGNNELGESVLNLGTKSIFKNLQPLQIQ